MLLARQRRLNINVLKNVEWMIAGLKCSVRAKQRLLMKIKKHPNDTPFHIILNIKIFLL